LNNITFGNVLENLLYISNQKKSSLAHALGYDISYINKWISSKNFPSAKRINEICKDISIFIVESLTESTYESVVNYFEIDTNIDNNELANYIEKILKEVYLEETRGMRDKSNQNIPKSTHSEEFYNSMSSMKPTVINKELINEINSVVNKGEDLEMMMSFNLFDLNYKDKISLSNMKRLFYEMSRSTKIKITLLMGLENNNDEKEQEVLNALLGLNLISTYLLSHT